LSPAISTVVEGHGEVAAVPKLLQRLAAEPGTHEVRFPRPVRCLKSRFVRGEKLDEEELRRAIELAIAKLPTARQGALLVLIDADESCPAVLGPRILKLAHQARGDVHVGICLAKCEFEAWLVASIESLRGRRGIRSDAIAHRAPESIPNAKGYLRSQMEPRRRYSERVDQVALTAAMDFRQARTCRSFQKFEKEAKLALAHVCGGLPS